MKIPIYSAIHYKQLFFGMVSFIIGVHRMRPLTTGGTGSAEYCYSVWLRHLTMAVRQGLCQRVPKIVAEFGPGDSIGVGLAALISGASRYIGLDVVRHSTLEKNIAIFDALVEMFQKKMPIPFGGALSQVKPELDDYRFPSDILTDKVLAEILCKDRLKKIRESIKNTNMHDSCVHYVVPWVMADIKQDQSIDMIFSQAVMEYCALFPEAYQRMYQWLRPGGFISHQIDFKSHDTFGSWDGHWTCPDYIWRLMRGRRPYFITRSTHNQHIQAIQDAGFSVVVDKKVILSPTISANQINQRFRSLDPQDLTIAGAFIQAQRPG